MRHSVSRAFMFERDKLVQLAELSKRTRVPQSVFMREALDRLLESEGLLGEDEKEGETP